MEIKRDAYLQQLIERKDNGMIKVITGIRRCGKSFLLFTIFKRYLLENGVDVDHIIEIALDGIENEELSYMRVAYQTAVAQFIFLSVQTRLFRRLWLIGVCGNILYSEKLFRRVLV